MFVRQQVRRENLETMISEYDGSAAELARAAKTNPSYLSQVRNGTASPSGRNRGIGDDLAARLERAAGKPGGWLDGINKTDSGGAIPCPLWAWHQFAQRAHTQEKLTTIACPVACSPDTFALRIESMPSMEPTFRNGDLVFVDPSLKPSNGSYVVIKPQDRRHLLRQAVLEDDAQYWRADNPNWPSQILRAEETDIVLGGVVFRGTIM